MRLQLGRSLSAEAIRFKRLRQHANEDMSASKPRLRGGRERPEGLRIADRGSVDDGEEKEILISENERS